jgi:hypothetical protein
MDALEHTESSDNKNRRLAMRYEEAMQIVEAQSNGWVDEADELDADSLSEFLRATLLCLAAVVLTSAVAYLAFAAFVTVGMSSLN